METVPMLDPADLLLLRRLFADESAAFRHHMGLTRSNTQEFFAPSAQADAVRSEKLAIMDSADAAQYVLRSPEGAPTFEEFSRFINRLPPGRIQASDHASFHRDMTLALEPDWLLLVRPDWKLAWASVCFPTRWSLSGKLLQPLAGIHQIVPKLTEELGKKIGMFFERMAPSEGWGRANWGVSSNAERNQHPSRAYTPLSNHLPMEHVYLRIESQHLVKLPDTGAIAFGIRILSLPMIEVTKHRIIALGLKQQLRTMPEEIAAYKGIPEGFWERL